MPRHSLDPLTDIERVARLEVQMESLTQELADANGSIKDLTRAVHELTLSQREFKAALRGAMWFGGLVATGIGGLGCAAMWIADKLWGGS